MSCSTPPVRSGALSGFLDLRHTEFVAGRRVVQMSVREDLLTP
ncbi:hypothetical protein ABQE93_00010 [Mycolicibacterium sp. XJ662]